MSLSSLSIKRPVLAIVMNVIIVLFGIIGYTFLGVREYPSIDPPVINVRTSYPGANADIVESQITEPLEKALNAIEGIRSISSSSNQGNSQITIEFNLSVDMETAANDVRDKVSQAVRQLPRDLDGLPSVTKSDANSDAIVALTLQSDSRSQYEVNDYAENVLAERLQTIPGVSNIQIWGQKKYAMRIWIDPAKLNAYGLTPLDIKAALDKENVELPSGKIAGDNTELTVKVAGKLANNDQFNQLIIANKDDKTIRLQDLGYAELASENDETILRLNGVPMIGMGLVPQPGANFLDISKEFYKRVEEIKKDLPKDFKLDIALDNTLFITQSVDEVIETLFIAILLVVVIIFLFFRDWLVALRPLIDIPVSLIATFFIMYLMGFSVNVLTLLAVVLATGLVVDDGIVVTENIFKKIEQGMKPIEAAIKGSNEIFFAVISTSITLAVVFLPVIFLEGFVGRLFREFGIVLSSAVLVSAFVSLTLTPMLNAYLVRKNPLQRSKFYLRTEPFFENMISGYGSSLNRFMRVRWMAFLLLLLSIAMILGFGKELKDELAPMEDRSWMRLSVTGPEGATYDYTDYFMQKLGSFVKDSVPEQRLILTVTAPGFAGSGAVNTGFMRLMLKEPKQRKRTQQQIANYIIKASKAFPEAKTVAIQQQTISQGGFGGLPVQFVIQAPNFSKLKEVVPRFLEEASKNSTFQSVDCNLKFNKPEIDLEIDREKANVLGVSISDVASTLQLALSGLRFSYFNMDGKQYQVIGQFDRANRDEPLDLASIYIRNKNNKLIQLDNIVSMSEVSSPPQLYHYNRYQSATVSASLNSGKTIGEGIEEMNKIAKKLLDDSFSTSLTGPSRDYKESSSNIIFAFVLALLLIYLILAAQFESFRDPFIIMITVPLALAGAVFFLWYFNETLNIFSKIGIIMLIGLVTKNGILIVEFANKLQEEGLSKWDAIQEAAKARLRPILMTSIATALGALPIAMALGAGAKSRMGMGIVIVGGLMFALILTLFVIPAFYSFISGDKKRKNNESA